MRTRTATATLGVGLLVGGVAGAALGGPELAGAQESVPTVASPASPPVSDRAGPDRDPGRADRRFDLAARLLDLSPNELWAQLDQDGTDLRELLSDAGIDREDLRAAAREAAGERLAEAVESGRLTQEQADAILDRGGPRPGMRHGADPAERAERLGEAVESGRLTQEQADAISERHEGMISRRAERQSTRRSVLAEVLGVDEEDVDAARADGTGIRGLIADSGADPADVRAQLTAHLKAEGLERLDAAVEAGDLTDDQANRIRERIEAGPQQGFGRRGR